MTKIPKKWLLDHDNAVDFVGVQKQAKKEFSRKLGQVISKFLTFLSQAFFCSGVVQR